jgi:hypothetical protein
MISLYVIFKIQEPESHPTKAAPGRSARNKCDVLMWRAVTVLTLLDLAFLLVPYHNPTCNQIPPLISLLLFAKKFAK